MNTSFKIKRSLLAILIAFSSNTFAEEVKLSLRLDRELHYLPSSVQVDSVAKIKNTSVDVSANTIIDDKIHPDFNAYKRDLKSDPNCDQQSCQKNRSNVIASLEKESSQLNDHVNETNKRLEHVQKEMDSLMEEVKEYVKLRDLEEGNVVAESSVTTLAESSTPKRPSLDANMSETKATSRNKIKKQVTNTHSSAGSDFLSDLDLSLVGGIAFSLLLAGYLVYYRSRSKREDSSDTDFEIPDTSDLKVSPDLGPAKESSLFEEDSDLKNVAKQFENMLPIGEAIEVNQLHFIQEVHTLESIGRLDIALDMLRRYLTDHMSNASKAVWVEYMELLKKLDRTSEFEKAAESYKESYKESISYSDQNGVGISDRAVLRNLAHKWQAHDFSGYIISLLERSQDYTYFELKELLHLMTIHDRGEDLPEYLK